jgi:DNA-binding response OmpR family regulator
MSYPLYGFQHSVLIIDDFSKSAQMIRSGLLSYPTQFEFCPSEYEIAVERIHVLKPDLVVVSLEFIQGSVIDFVEKTRKNQPSLPSIFLTEPHLIEIQTAILSMGGEFNMIARPTAEPSELLHRMDRAMHELPTHRVRRGKAA